MTTWLKVIFLMVIFLSATMAHSGADEKHGDKVMLSLKIAKVKKETLKIERYKSIARQKKLNRSLSDSFQSYTQ